MKTLKLFLKAFAMECSEIKAAADRAFLDLFPYTTRRLSEWLDQFGIYETEGQTEIDKRNALDAAWKAKGSLSPSNFQTVLRNAGFDVYVHEWWEPGDEPATGVPSCPTPRDPRNYLTDEGEYSSYGDTRCGEPNSRCGNAWARAGSRNIPLGYPLVNKTFVSAVEWLVRCGEPQSRCGVATARCGNIRQFYNEQVEPPLPTDPLKYPFFVYVGAQNFPDLASVPAARRDEFERMLLKYRPTHLWVGVLVTYT